MPPKKIRQTKLTLSQSSVSVSSKERYRAWMFTLNNFLSGETSLPEQWAGKYCIWQHEQGENETPHLQGYIIFENAKSFSAVKSICSRCHWEYRKGSHEQAKAYCSKFETRIAGPWNYGKEPSQGHRSDLEQLKNDLDHGLVLKDVSKKHFSLFLKYQKGIQAYLSLQQDSRCFKSVVSVIYGPTGVGKSNCIKKRYPDAYWVTQPPHSSSTLWFDGYTNQATVVFDEFYGWVPYSFLLRVCDEYPLKVQYKGGMVEFKPIRIFFTSNHPPSRWYKNFTDEQLQPLWRRIDWIVHKESFTKYTVHKDSNDLTIKSYEDSEFPVSYADRYHPLMTDIQNESLGQQKIPEFGIVHCLKKNDNDNQKSNQILDQQDDYEYQKMEQEFNNSE